MMGWIVGMWILAFATVLGTLQLLGLENVRLTLGVVYAACFLGFPLLVVVPLVLLPLLRRLHRRAPEGAPWLLPLAGIVLSLPLTVWPTAVLG